MFQKVSRAERNLGAFNADKVDFFLVRTISKQFIDGDIIVNKAETDKGEILWEGADDAVPESHRFVLGLIIPGKERVVPLHVQLYKEVK